MLLSGTDVDKIVAYDVSESSVTPAVDASRWVAVSATASLTKKIPFTLSDLDGTKTIYVWYKNSTGKVSSVASDTILLSRTYSVLIAAGAVSTPTKSVTLSLSAGTNGVTGYYVSETSTAPSVSANGWVAVSGAGTTYSNSGVSFTLSSANGTKTVYAWFKDSIGEIQGGVSDTISLARTKKITAFSFKAATNGALSTDVTGYIAGSKIGVSLPKGTPLTGLIPTFTTTGVRAVVNNITQTSGTTAQSFSSTVIYVVNDADGGSTRYSVTAVAQVPVPDTGQTTGYTPTFGEDNDYSVHTQSYTVGSGVTAGTVTDKVTGLIWQQCSAGQSGAACATGLRKNYNWAAARTYCSKLSLGGSRAWRLPTVTELSWITQHKGTTNSIDGTVFPATGSNPADRFVLSHNDRYLNYWTSTPSALAFGDAWYVAFAYPDTWTWIQSNGTYVRCVR